MINWDPLIEKFLEKNSQINLSSIRDKNGVLNKHILDSLELDKLIQWKPGMTIADVGTGGGFPLMPLAVSHPECKFTGIDSIKKKTIAVSEILTSLNITNVTMLWTRMENLNNQTFDLVTARAVAYSDKLLGWVYPLIKKGGKIGLMKQFNNEERNILIAEAQKKGLKIDIEHHYHLFEGDIDRIIYILSK